MTKMTLLMSHLAVMMMTKTTRTALLLLMFGGGILLVVRKVMVMTTVTILIRIMVLAVMNELTTMLLLRMTTVQQPSWTWRVSRSSGLHLHLTANKSCIYIYTNVHTTLHIYWIMFEHTFKDMVCSKNMILPVLNTSLLYIYIHILLVWQWVQNYISKLSAPKIRKYTM